MKRRKSRRSQKILSVFLGIFTLFLLTSSLLWFMGRDDTPEVSENSCEFHFVDVGQGDCSLFMTDSAAVVIDAGPRSESLSTAAYIAAHTGAVDYMILTHPDEDHIGGAVDVLHTVKVKNVIMTDAVKDTYSYTKLIDTMEKYHINVIKAVAGKQYSAGGMKITLLAPLGDFEDYNDYSIVTRIAYGKVSSIVPGDAEQKSESLMLKKYGDSLKTDILKLAHHGSSTSTGTNFLEATNPDFAVISCGKNNDYGHPHREILDLLSDFGIETHRTDKEGSIVFITDGENIQYKK